MDKPLPDDAFLFISLKLFFTSTLSNHHSRVYFMTLGKLEELQRSYAVWKIPMTSSTIYIHHIYAITSQNSSFIIRKSLIRGF